MSDLERLIYEELRRASVLYGYPARRRELASTIAAKVREHLVADERRRSLTSSILTGYVAGK